jgi:hypothetical protein
MHRSKACALNGGYKQLLLIGSKWQRFGYIQSSDHREKTRIFAMQEIIRNIYTIWPKSAISSVIKRSLRVRFTPVDAVAGIFC